MKISKKLSLILVILLVFTIKIDVVNAKELKCVYEMYPVNYYVKDNVPIAVDGGITIEKAILEFNGTSKDDYTIKHMQQLNGGLTKEFKDDSFAKKVFENGKCPEYVKVKIKANDSIDALDDADEFFREQNKFFNSGSRGKKYPMFLVKQNGKNKTTPGTNSIMHALNHWTTIINSGNTNSQNLARGLYNYAYNNSMFYDRIITRKEWVQFSNYVLGTDPENEEEKQRNEGEVELKQAERDYCYYYCYNIKCDQYTGTAYDQCNSSYNYCLTTSMPKCTEAYNACKKIQSSSEKDKCLKTQFSEKGLDTNYPTTRNQELAKLQEEIKKLREIVEAKKASNIKIEVGKNAYKLTCDDVSMFHDIWVVIIILAPILTIVMGVLDFGKAVISSDTEKMSKAWKKFPKRLLAVVLLLLVPHLISLLLSLTTDEGARDTSLMYCIINGGE